MPAEEPGPRFYLDTSAQVERHGGEDARREVLKELLRGGGHATSSQVLREWNAIVVGACSELLNALAVAKNRADLVARLRKGYGREPSHRWMVTEWLLGADTDLRIVEMRARRFLRVGSKAWFKVEIATIRDGTDCPIARRAAVQDPSGGRWSYDKRCKKTEDICSQHTFLSGGGERAKAAARALQDSSRAQDRRMGKNAIEILARMPTDDSKGKACWGAGGLGGDICIALECAPEETLLTTDASFDLICPAIGIKHQRVT